MMFLVLNKLQCQENNQNINSPPPKTISFLHNLNNNFTFADTQLSKHND